LAQVWLKFLDLVYVTMTLVDTSDLESSLVDAKPDALNAPQQLSMEIQSDFGDYVEEKIVNFEPGDSGLTVHSESGSVKSVQDDSQAAKKGVKVGWTMRTIRGPDYFRRCLYLPKTLHGVTVLEKIGENRFVVDKQICDKVDISAYKRGGAIEFDVRIDIEPGEGLGIGFGMSTSTANNRESVMITRINNDGAIAKFNEQFPENAIKAHDNIYSVDGEPDFSLQEVTSKVKKQGGSITLKISRSLPAQGFYLRYYKSRDLADQDVFRGLQWGSVVDGFDDGEWVRIEEKMQRAEFLREAEEAYSVVFSHDLVLGPILAQLDKEEDDGCCDCNCCKNTDQDCCLMCVCAPALAWDSCLGSVMPKLGCNAPDDLWMRAFDLISWPLMALGYVLDCIKLLFTFALYPLDWIYRRLGGTGGGFQTTTESEPEDVSESCNRQAAGKAEAKRGEGMWANYKYLVLNTHPLLSLFTAELGHPFCPFSRLGLFALIASFNYYMAAKKQSIFEDGPHGDIFWWYLRKIGYSIGFTTLPALAMEKLVTSVILSAWALKVEKNKYFVHRMEEREKAFLQDLAAKLLPEFEKAVEDEDKEEGFSFFDFCAEAVTEVQAGILTMLSDAVGCICWIVTGFFMYGGICTEQLNSDTSNSVWESSLLGLGLNLFFMWFATGSMSFVANWKYQHWLGRRVAAQGMLIPPLPEAERELLRIFCRMDDDCDGRISLDELTDFFDKAMGLKALDCSTIFMALDRDVDGKISSQEFRHTCLQLYCETQGLCPLAVRKIDVWDVLDAPGNYVITREGTGLTKFKETRNQVSELKKGTQVQVVEVVTLPEAERIRGRIRDPPGWISLKNTKTGYRWANQVTECITDC